MSQNINLPKRKIKNPVIGVVIQARMTSKRFPGKSMAKLAGKPVIEHVIERAKLIKPVNHVILAVPDTDESEPMLELADKLGIQNFCGSEYNVLERYLHAAYFFKLDVIVRITGDCPFINPRVCSEVLQLLLWRKLDYASNIFPNRTYPKGLDCEVFTLDCIEACYMLVNPLETKYLEHVTLWMQDHSKQLRTGNVEQRVDVSHKNWCVDYLEDITRLEELIKSENINA